MNKPTNTVELSFRTHMYALMETLDFVKFTYGCTASNRNQNSFS